MGNTIKGWTKKTNVRLITQSIEDFETVTTDKKALLDINFQPMPPATVNRKPPEQRTWTWWNILITKGPLLKTDDIIIAPSGIRYKIQSTSNWTESGFGAYEAIEDYGT